MTRIRIITPDGGTRSINFPEIDAGGNVATSAASDGRSKGYYGTGKYGRCLYGTPRIGIYGADTYGGATYK
jgi:hypothetical protein